MEGLGSLYYAENHPCYEGSWKEDMFNGFGTLYNEKPTILNEQFDYSNFELLEMGWIKY